MGLPIGVIYAAVWKKSHVRKKQRERNEASMLTLYYSPGACSMASHICLEEVGADFDRRPIAFSEDEQRSEVYLKINPRGKVPALVTDDGVITENSAIIIYLAKRFAEARLFPVDPFEEARCISMMTWFSSAVHPSFARFLRPERFTSVGGDKEGVRAAGKEAFFSDLKEIDSLLADRQWLSGAEFTGADPYALVFYSWGTRFTDLPVQELRNYSRWKDRMLGRAAVQTVLAREGNPLSTVV